VVKDQGHKESPSPEESGNRVVRVFVSSTFRDMHAEREELVKRVFPLLRRLCEQRGVVRGEVDLRWGIPDEERAEGQFPPICLGKINQDALPPVHEAYRLAFEHGYAGSADEIKPILDSIQFTIRETDNYS
jgi:hypothetical protein